MLESKVVNMKVRLGKLVWDLQCLGSRQVGGEFFMKANKNLRLVWSTNWHKLKENLLTKHLVFPLSYFLNEASSSHVK